MYYGTDARGWLVVSVVVLIIGCEGPLQKVPTPPSPVPARAAQADVKPVPDLRIPDPPSRPAVLPASATAEAKPVPAEPTSVPPADRPRQLYQQAAAHYAGIDSYIVRMRRREVVNGKSKPEELLLFKFRKEPWSVYFKWLGQEGNGREALYVKGRYEDKLHTLLAAGDMPLAPAGKRIALPPESIFVRSSSRHAVTDAGIGHIIEQTGRLLDGVQRGDPRAGTLKYLGPMTRPEFSTTCEAVEHRVPPGAEAQLPKGGRRLCLFDPVQRLPVLVQTFDEAGREVEYYCYDLFQHPVKLDDDDFNPDKLWGPKR